MSQDNVKVLCQTPTPGKQGTRIHKWKYDLVRKAILSSIPKGAAGVEFQRLPDLVESRIPAQDLRRLGSVSWYTTTVKLDLETHSEIERVPGSKPQRVRKL